MQIAPARGTLFTIVMDKLSSLIEQSKQAVRHWWLLLVVGVALLAVGILVFIYPARSYLDLSVLFGWLILFSGVMEVVLAARSRHFVTGRGWMLAGGIIEIILGAILVFNVALSAVTLPIFLGFWLLMRSFSTIGLASDMHVLGIRGSGWTVLTGVLLLICSLWMLLQPLAFGTTAVVVWVGLSLLFAGISTVSLSLQLRSAHCIAEAPRR